MPGESALWRWLVTDIDGVNLTLLDHLASDRLVTPKLNQPLEISGTAPSDNSEINRLHTDGFRFMAEGVRQLYCFRRESEASPRWVIRASGLILQVDDAAQSDDARTRFTAWDAWQYLFYRAAIVPVGEFLGLVEPDGYVFPAGTRGSEIIQSLIEWAIELGSFSGDPVPAATLQMYLDLGEIQDTYELVDGYTIQPALSIGEVLTDLCSFAYLDIVFRPIFDVGRPGILNEMDVLSHAPPEIGAGTFNWSAIFAWDRPGRSTTGMDDLFDGTQRADIIQYWNGPGGDPVALQWDTDALNIYGEYWSMRFFPAQVDTPTPVEVAAATELSLRAFTKQTLTINPATGRAPVPLLDYQLGDRVPVYASDRLRQPVPPTDIDLERFVRVYEIPIAIDDNGVETVNQLVVGPASPAPGPADEDLFRSDTTVGFTAITAAQRGQRRLTQTTLQRPTVVNP